MYESARTGCVVKMNILLILIVLVLCICTSIVYGQEDDCSILGGECISIENCPVLKPYIQNSPRTRHMIVQYHCGYDGDTPKVCCPPDDCNNLQLMSKTCGTDYVTEDYKETDFHVRAHYDIFGTTRPYDLAVIFLLPDRDLTPEES